jgi:hypothetical protein
MSIWCCGRAVGFDLEPIWCCGCGAISEGAVGVGLSFGCRGLSFGCRRSRGCWRFVFVRTMRRIGKVGERKEKKTDKKKRENNNILIKWKRN